MTTITAKELRTNLDKIVARARAGETIKVTYRSKPAFTITPGATKKTGPAPGSREAIEVFLTRVAERKKARGSSFFDPDKSIKELYHEMLDNDPKYKPPYHG